MDGTRQGPGSAGELVGRHWVAIACALALLAAGLLARDYGVTWDEGVQARYGELCLEYFRSGLEDPRCSEYLDLRHYGPLLEMLQAGLYAGRPELRFDVRHLFLATLSVLFIPVLARYCTRFGPAAIGPLAAVAIVMLPRLLGHAPNNSKDVPFALAIALYMTALARLFGERRQDWPSFGLGALCAGLVLAIRPGGLPMIALLFVAAAALGQASIGRLPDREQARDLVRKSLFLWALAWLLMVLPWPWAHGSPLLHPWEAITRAASFDRSYDVLFAGETISSDRLPRHYLVWYLLITTPIPLLLLASVGLVLELGEVRRSTSPQRRFMLGLTLLWIALPVGVAMLLRPNLYDGVRHFLFVLPAVAVLSALGAWHCATRLGRTPLRPLAWPLVLAVLATPLLPIVRLHPYQTSYFNELVGGLAGASGRYDVDYWGTSLAEATRWVNERAPASLPGDGGRPVVLLLGSTSPYPKAAVEYAAGPGVEVVTLGELVQWAEPRLSADYYVALDRYGMDAFFGAAPIAHRVERDGTTLALVRDLRGLPIAALPVPPTTER